MNRYRKAIAITVFGGSFMAHTAAFGAGASMAKPLYDAGCRTAARIPAPDPHEYDTCIHDSWGNIRRCPPWTIVVQVDGDVRCVPE
ncbi:hypothetical protein JMUB6875_43250 [Nocardia sp. JMUB6875]